MIYVLPARFTAFTLPVTLLRLLLLYFCCPAVVCRFTLLLRCPAYVPRLPFVLPGLRLFAVALRLPFPHFAVFYAFLYTFIYFVAYLLHLIAVYRTAPAPFDLVGFVALLRLRSRFDLFTTRLPGLPVIAYFILVICSCSLYVRTPHRICSTL